MEWKDIAAHVAARHELLAARPDSLSVRWHGPGTDAVGPQKLVVLAATLLDVRCVMIVALVGPEHAWPHADALVEGGALLAGGIVLKNGAYMLRVSALLDTLQPAELDTLIDYAASSATAARARLPRVPVPDPELFGWMQD